MPAAAVVAGVAAVASAGIGAYTASQASKDQKKAAKKAAKAQEAAAAQARSDLAPWRTTGQGALGSLADLYGLNGQGAFNESALTAFKNSPDYQVGLREGINALDQSASARGNLLSGGQVKAVERYGADYATQKFGDYVSRLYALAGMGQSAAANQANTSMAAGDNAANNYYRAGEASASGIVGTGNKISEGIDAAVPSILKGFGSSYGTSGYSSNPTYASGLNTYYNDFA